MDEYSDFQMAVQMPTTNVVSMGIPPPLFSNNHVASPPSHGKKSSSSSSSGVRFFSDSSPVHSIASHTSKSDLVHSQLASNQPVVTTSPAINKFGASVGSRLANYDLGLSGPQTTQTNGFQNNLEFSLTASSFASFPKTINNVSNNHHHQQPSLPIPRNNQDLLIGEEDKYSALRMLIETDFSSSSSSSVFEKPAMDVAAPANTENQLEAESEPKPRPVQINSNNISNNVNSPTDLFDLNISNSIHSNNSTVVNSNNLMGALKSPGVHPRKISPPSPSKGSFPSDSNDFGDFQSFAGFASPAATTTTSLTSPNCKSSPFPVMNSTLVENSPSQSLPPFVPQLQLLEPLQNPVTFDFLTPTTTTTVPIQNGYCESDEGDTEFGDFVSVEPVISNVHQNNLPPVPAPAPLPMISPWNKHLDLAPLTLIKQTPPPLPPILQEDKENIEDIMDIGGYFSKYTSPLDIDLPQPSTKSQQQPPPPTQVSTIDDDFDTFSGFKSATNYDNSTDNSDQDRAVDCSTPQSNQTNVPAPALSSSSSTSFIRTSLIRNDKVTDIDPIKWNQSVEESNNECTMLDYSSFDRKDFSSTPGGKSKFLDVSPETRSIASLDLGNYVTVDYSETGTVNNNLNHSNNNNNNNNLFSPVVSSQNHHQQSNGIKSSSSLIPGTLPFQKGIIPSEEQNIYDEFDKYQCFREECENEKERYYSEWSRCLYACKEMISKAFAVFNGVSTSEVLREVVADDKGYSYVMNILEIYRISQRVQKSAARLGVHSRLESISAEIVNLWETLSAFLLGTCVSTEISQENLDHDDCCMDDPSCPEDSVPSCGVCLCTVNTSVSSQFLDYGGKLYHCKCANFWVNEVDAILPSLSYVSNIDASSSITGAATGSSFHGNSSSQSKHDKTNSLA